MTLQQILYIISEKKQEIKEPKRNSSNIRTNNNLECVGRMKNYIKQIKALKSDNEAVSLYKEFVHLDFSINEMQSVLNLCEDIPDNSAIRILSLNIRHRMERIEEKMKKDTEAFKKKMNAKPRMPFVTIISTPQGGQNKRY